MAGKAMAGIGYELKVTGGKDEINLITEKGSEIKTMLFRKKTLTNQVEFGDESECEFEISGTLDDKTKEATKYFADWALDTDDDSLFRTVEISVRKDQEEKTTAKVLRNYSFSNMYVIDYEEEFGNGIGQYKLTIGQKAEKSVQDIQT